MKAKSPTHAASIQDIKATIIRALERAPSRRGYLDVGQKDGPLYLTYSMRDKRGKLRKRRLKIGTMRDDAQKMAVRYPRCGGVPEDRLPHLVQKHLGESGMRWAYQNAEGRLQFKEALAQLKEEHAVALVPAGEKTEYLDCTHNPHGESVRKDVIRLVGEDPSASTVTLQLDDLMILDALAQSKATMTQDELVRKTPMSERTIATRLKYLRDAGLVHRPRGDRRGEAITDAGRKAIDEQSQP